MYDQIVIGRGASALSFLYYSGMSSAEHGQEFLSRSTLVIGGCDLWSKIAKKKPEHRFGQPAQIVSAPNKKMAPTVKVPEFQTARDIEKDLHGLQVSLSNRKDLKFVSGNVTKVDRLNGSLYVECDVDEGNGKARKTYQTKRVIVATGFGPSSIPPVALPEQIVKSEGDWGSRVMGGTEYLYSEVKRTGDGDPFVVAVQGAAATASWAVLRAIALGATHIIWISRSGFGEANPAGRNSDVLKLASQNRWLTIGSVKGIKIEGEKLCLTLCASGDKPQPENKLSSLMDAYKKWYQSNKYSPAKKREAELKLETERITADTEVLVDNYVYALGADPTRDGGAGAILSSGIKQTLEPVFDNDKRFGDIPADTTVALKSKSGDVWVVGAAVFRSLGIKALNNVGDKFKNIGQMMSESGTPPEGIAAILASMKAVTGYYNVVKMNFQTADFKEIERWVAKLYESRTKTQISEKTKRVMTDQIVAMRKHSVHGLSQEEVDNLNDPEFWDSMFELQNEEYAIDVIAQAS